MAVALGVPAAAQAEAILYEQRLNDEPSAILLPAQTPGGGVLMVLDTGVYGEVFDSSVAGFLPPSSGETKIRSFGLTQETRTFVAPPIMLGSWKLPEMVCVKSDTDWSRKAIGRDVRGILGWGAIRESTIKMDFDRHQLQFVSGFERPAAAQLYAGAPSQETAYVFLSLENDIQIPIIRSTMEGLSIEWIIDTGTNHCLGLKHELFEKLVRAGAIRREPKGVDGETATAVGDAQLLGGKFTKGTLLGVALQDVPVYDTANVSLIGLAFLINFNLTFDFSDNRLYFTKRNAEPPMLSTHMLGAVLEFEKEGCRIRDFYPEHGGVTGAAAAAGLAVGDRILQMGPLRGGEINRSAIYNLCRTSARKAIEVQATRAKTRELFKTTLQIPEIEYLYPPR